jgi:hypothetical protein
LNAHWSSSSDFINIIFMWSWSFAEYVSLRRSSINSLICYNTSLDHRCRKYGP